MASVSSGSRITLPSYYAIAFTLLLMVVLFLWMFHPTIGELAMIATEIPRYEAKFGCRGGWIERTLPDGTVWKAYGVVRVDPKGRLAGLGFVDGDVPVAHHGDGVGSFCWVLEQADAGRAAELWVVNPSRGADSRRKILVPGRAGEDDGG